MNKDLENLAIRLNEFTKLPWHGCPYCKAIYGHIRGCELNELIAAIERVLTSQTRSGTVSPIAPPQPDHEQRPR